MQIYKQIFNSQFANRKYKKNIFNEINSRHTLAHLPSIFAENIYYVIKISIMDTDILLGKACHCKNKLLIAQMSLIENLLSMGRFCIDLADFMYTTGKSSSMYLILEKQCFSSLNNTLDKINVDEIPKTVKSVWIDIWFGSEITQDDFHGFCNNIDKVFPGKDVVVIDAYNMENNQNHISIVGFD